MVAHGAALASMGHSPSERGTRFFRDVLATYTRYGGVNAKIFPHSVYSVCLRGGIESRRDTTEGGVASRPRILTLGFIGNAIDSLCSIWQLCFIDKTCTLAELLDAVRSNWAGPRGSSRSRSAGRTRSSLATGYGRCWEPHKGLPPQLYVREFTSEISRSRIVTARSFRAKYRWLEFGTKLI